MGGQGLIGDASTVWRPAYPVDVRRTLSHLRRGASDPCHRVAADRAVWRTSRMPSGPVTYRLTQPHLREIRADAWGDGAAELIAAVPRLLGCDDRPETFEPRHPVLRDAARRLEGLRVPATGLVMEALIPAVLEQKVVGWDATDAWRRLMRAHGESAPGPAPAGMRVPPTAAAWRRVPSWDWHRAGVDPRRAQVAVRCAGEADALETAAAAGGGPQPVYQRLLAIPGVGRWTAAQVGHRALGDADALPVGDFHLAKDTGWALAGRRLGDGEIEAFLQPWQPHRFRVVRLLELIGARAPRRGPRMPRQDYRAL